MLLITTNYKNEKYNYNMKFNVYLCVSGVNCSTLFLNTEVTLYVDIVPVNFIKSASYFHRTALHFACFYGHLHLVYFLLFTGSEIKSLDKKKCTPLMKVIQRFSFSNCIDLRG